MTRKYYQQLLIMRSGLIAGLLLLWQIAAFANPVNTGHTQVQLISESPTVQVGHPLWLALKIELEEHWYTYWRNPGDSGMAGSITWELPEGFTAGDIQWPYPQLLPTPPS